MKILILIGIWLFAYTADASEIRMYHNLVYVDSIHADMATAIVDKPNDEIWIRSHVNSKNFLFQCLTTRNILANYFSDETLLTLPYEKLFEKLSKENAIFNCNARSNPFYINYQGKKVLLYSGVLILNN